mmetsp:Transcript_49732/g.106273  ORF Transcript_49732/g.106273 Transcript_49732/m.106273 type:complete len:207 (+) Transcript_49732:460-1080(+)
MGRRAIRRRAASMEDEGRSLLPRRRLPGPLAAWRDPAGAALDSDETARLGRVSSPASETPPTSSPREDARDSETPLRCASLDDHSASRQNLPHTSVKVGAARAMCARHAHPAHTRLRRAASRSRRNLDEIPGEGSAENRPRSSRERPSRHCAVQEGARGSSDCEQRAQRNPPPAPEGREVGRCAGCHPPAPRCGAPRSGGSVTAPW